MKTLLKSLAVASLLTLSFTPLALHAQDDMQPPPPDQGAPPPPDQGPAPDQAPPPDQGAPSDQDQGDADQGASFQEFYNQLGSQGTWVQTDDYGYAFQPNVSDPNWAPYTVGHWVYTNVGWMWVSNEPWGWATYHYGRWVNIDGYGWVWVPGYRWAPAWVSWRYGGGYCGWAPLPPATLYGAEFADPGVAIGIGFHFGGDVDVSFGIGPGCYNFIPVTYMGYGDYHGHYLDRSRNFVVINNTTNVTNININNSAADRGHFRGVSTGGPPLAQVNAHSEQHVPTVTLAEANHPGESRLSGNTVSVFAPRVNAGTIHTARPANVAQTFTHPTFNRGTSITQPLAVNARVTPAAPSEQAIAAAQAAEAKAPAHARVATSTTQPKVTETRPLTALAPVAQIHQTTTAPTNETHTATQHETGASAFTGAPATRTESAPASNYHPQTEQKPAATSAFTGEPATHTESAPSTYHPSTEVHESEVHETPSTPAPTYHPQTEVHETAPAPAPIEHTESAPPAYHPQVEQHAAPAPQESHPSGGGGGGGKPAPQAAGNGTNKNQH